ncbi:MAG: methyltransferase domain-containing protein [Thermomicrobiales bacterium]
MNPDAAGDEEQRMNERASIAAESVDFEASMPHPKCRKPLPFWMPRQPCSMNISASYRMLDIKPGMAVLDAGCGTGDDARAMAGIVGASGHVVGLDTSTGILEVARARSEAIGIDVEFIQGDVTDLPFSDDTFDACRSERLLQHLESPVRGLQEMIRVTKPGGRIFLAEVDCDTLVVDVPAGAIVDKLRRSGRPASRTRRWADRSTDWSATRD